jgi:hydrogenase expression/formation protein HypC
MCLGIAGKIIQTNLDGTDLATAEIMGARRTINIGLLKEDLRAGDWVVIHVGFAIAKMDEEQAKASLALLRQLAAGGEDDAT